MDESFVQTVLVAFFLDGELRVQHCDKVGGDEVFLTEVLENLQALHQKQEQQQKIRNSAGILEIARGRAWGGRGEVDDWISNLSGSLDIDISCAGWRRDDIHNFRHVLLDEIYVDLLPILARLVQ